MRFFALHALLLTTLGCGPGVPSPDEPFLLAKARAAVAFAEAEHGREPPDEPATLCDDCEGTGTVPSGDGLARVPCECGETCRCEAGPGTDAVTRSPDRVTRADRRSPFAVGAPRSDGRPGREARPQQGSTARRKRLLYFTAAWCPTCRANETTLSALASRGWSVGPGEECHVQAVDLDARADLRNRYGVNAVPAWLLIDDGREIRRRYGVLDPFAVGRLWGD